MKKRRPHKAAFFMFHAGALRMGFIARAMPE